MNIDNKWNVRFDEGFYKEPMEKTYRQYIEEKDTPDLLVDFFSKEELEQVRDVLIALPDEITAYFHPGDETEEEIRDLWLSLMGDLYVCSMEGMTEMFRCTVEGETATISSGGFEPYLSSRSPYHGGIYAVVLALAQIVAAGGNYKDMSCVFRGYLEGASSHGENAGKGLAALLGAYEAWKGFGLAPFAGKMPEGENVTEESGCTIGTMITARAFCQTNKDYVVTSDFKREDNKIVRFCIPYDQYGRPIYEEAIKTYKQIYKMMKHGYIQAACPVSYGGTLEALAKMCFANELGVRLDEDLRPEQLIQKAYGAIIAEIKPRDIRHIEIPCMFLGEVVEEPMMEYLEEIIPVEDLMEAWENNRK